MKRWQSIALASSTILLLFLSQRKVALAQDSGSKLLSDFIVPILTIFANVLDYFVDSVTGNTLTYPAGNQLAADIASVIGYLMSFLAQLSGYLVG